MTISPTSTVVVVDSDVFSFIFADRPEAQLYLNDLHGVIPAVTFVTVAEIKAGAYKANWGTQKLADLGKQLNKYLFIPCNFEVIEEWARIQAAIRGRQFPENDAWIAACCNVFGCPLLSHNRKDFQDVPGLRLISHAPNEL